MRKKKFYLLSMSELSLMKIMWDSDKSLTISEIIKNTSDVKWAENSLYPIMGRLVDKKYVKIVGKVSTKTTPSKLYMANITSNQYTKMFLQRMPGFPNGEASIGDILSYFSEDMDVNEVIDELEKWIADFS